jgi:hypothetical protein
MFTLGQLLACLLVPAVLAVLLGLLRRILPGGGVALAGGGIALAAGVGHVLAALAVGDALFPPLRGWHWYIVGALAIAGAAVVPGRWRLPTLVLVAGGAVFGALLPLAGVPLSERLAWSAGAAGTTLFAGLFGERAVAAPTDGRWGHAVLLVVAGGTAAGIGLGGSKDLALLAATVASAVAGSALRAWRTPVSGLAAPVAALLAGHLALGAGYAELPRSSAILLAAGLPAAGLTALLPGRLGTILALVVATLLVGGALALALGGMVPGESYG